MTVAEIAEILKAAGIGDPLHEALLIMSEYSKKSRAYLLADPALDFTSEEMTEAVRARAGRYPLQYIFGKWEFCGLTFKVNESCLIPRADTEVIVERAVKEMPREGSILDLCTGSGCIIGAVMRLSGCTRGAAVELYPETAEVARQNLADLGLDGVEVILGDACTDLFPADVRFDVIVANPPYVTAEEMRSLEPELDYEPAHALTDGGDGMSIIDAIIRIYKDHLSPGGAMIIEHGWRQGETVRALAEESCMSYEPIFDYGGNCRGAVLKNL